MSYIARIKDYLNRNGIKNTAYAVADKFVEAKRDYRFVGVSDEELQKQRRRVWPAHITVSIVVPTYETKEEYLRACIESVLNQTYEHFELILADASVSDSVRNIVAGYKDYRIKYMHLEKNAGISVNTNAGIRVAIGDYIGLLDHDDILTPDCLYEYVSLIEKGRREGVNYAFIYCDEDKCDEKCTSFYEPNFKPDFNLDLLLSNNYICHFLVMNARLFKELKLREEYDGAQDYDVVLRAYAATCEMSAVKRVEYGHIQKVLYHWRCHKGSTASNPQSKDYAYEAGRRAVEDYLKRKGISADVLNSAHKGFYNVVYKDGNTYGQGESDRLKRVRMLTSTTRGRIAYYTFEKRYDVGAIGGTLIKKNRHIGGPMDNSRTCPFDGMNIHLSGYIHRAVLKQSFPYLDIRNMIIRNDLAYLFIKYAKDDRFLGLFDRQRVLRLEESVSQGEYTSTYVDISSYLLNKDLEDYEYLDLSLILGREIGMDGYLCLYDPGLNMEIK